MAGKRYVHDSHCLSLMGNACDCRTRQARRRKMLAAMGAHGSNSARKNGAAVDIGEGCFLAVWPGRYT